MKYIPLLILCLAITPTPFQDADIIEVYSNGVIRGESYVQFADGGRLWVCGKLADGTIDTILDSIASEASKIAQDEL